MSDVKDYRLNAKQIHILKLVYKFRFMTAPLLASYRNDSNSTVTNTALKKLVAKGYLERNYGKSYKFQFKAASYYLMPKAMNLLKTEHDFDPKSLHTMYKNNNLSPGYVDRYLDALRIFLVIRQTYPGTFHMFTKTELVKYSYFPEKKPDLCLTRIKPSDKQPNEYLLEILGNDPLFVLKKRINDYIEHFDSGDWEAETENNYPAILLVCSDGKTETKLQEHLNKVFDNTGIDDLAVLTTTLKALLDSKSRETAVWSDAVEPEELLSLEKKQ